MVEIKIQKKHLYLLSAVLIFLVGVGGCCWIKFWRLSSSWTHFWWDWRWRNWWGASWESSWIAVNKRNVYLNGGTDVAGNVINLNHNLGTSSLIIQVLYAKDSGTFPSSPNLDTITYNTAHRDANIYDSMVHGGTLVQGIKADSIDKLVTGNSNVDIWADMTQFHGMAW